jgi:phosphatidate cytidylyltransferase
MTDLSALPLVGLTLVLCLAGILGDLLMSTLKRYTGTKDSSNIFPGHGGMLDRFDSFYLAGPIAVILLEIFA